MNTKSKKQEFCAKHGFTNLQFEGKEKYEGSLYLSGLTAIPDGFNPTVGGSLYLSGLTAIPDGFNPTVGGYLGLSGLTAIPDGFNPTVGGSLYLSGLTAIPDGFNPTVGGYLYLSGLTAPTKTPPKILSWHGGKFIKVDGIFTEVVSRRGNVWRVKKVHDDKIFYLVSDGNGKYAHGDTLKEAKYDLIYN
jgi:hypothetical protein